MNATVPAYGSTPTAAMTSLTRSFLRFPSPHTVLACGGGIRGSLREVDATGGEKVAHAVEPGLPIYIEPVIRGDLEGTKWFTGVRITLLQVRIKHLFPTHRVYGGRVRDHAVEVE